MIATAQFLPVWAAEALPMTIRPASLLDTAEIVRRFRKYYPQRATDATVPRAIPWLKRCLAARDHLVLMGPCGFGIAHLGTYYGCERKATIDVLCSEPSRQAMFEGLRMVRKMVRWAGRNGAASIRLGADTGVDFAAFGKRLKARAVVRTSYEIPTRG